MKQSNKKQSPTIKKKKTPSIDSNESSHSNFAMRYYSIEETANLLKTTHEKIYEKFKKTGDNDHLLFPTIFLRNPIRMRQRINTKTDSENIEEMLDGYFEVDGIYDAEWDHEDRVVLSIGTNARVKLRHDYSVWIPIEAIRIHKTEFLVSQGELKDYMSIMGIEHPEEMNNPELCQKKNEALEKDKKSKTLGEFIEEQLNEGVKDEIIASKLRDEFKMTYLQITRALNLGNGLNPTQISAQKKRGERACKRGEKLLKRL